MAYQLMLLEILSHYDSNTAGGLNMNTIKELTDQIVNNIAKTCKDVCESHKLE
jgi:hypothetical protein